VTFDLAVLDRLVIEERVELDRLVGRRAVLVLVDKHVYELQEIQTQRNTTENNTRCF